MTGVPEAGRYQLAQRRPTMKRSTMILFAAVLAAPLLVMSVAPPDAEARSKKKAPAKNLDFGLFQRAFPVIDFLSAKRYASVGILPFKVQKGSREASYDAAPLAAALPGRFENALLMSMEPDEKLALKILRDPAGHAAKHKVGAWTKDKKAFDKLFATSYPVAWGKGTVKPSVFLTGTVKNTGDRAVTTIEVVGFTKDDWTDDGLKTFPVTTFTVRTDRALLRDLGYAYALSPGVAKRGMSAAARDKQAVDEVNEEESGEKESGVKPVDVAGIRFDLWYGDEKQVIKPLAAGDAGAKSPLFQVAPVPADTKVTLGLTRLTDEGKRLGVIVKINGISIYQMDERDSMQCLKWLFDAADKGKEFKFTGFQMDADGKEVRPFKVLTSEESLGRVSEMGNRAGWIDIDVFASGEEEQEDEQLMVSTRGLARGKTPGTLKALREGLLKKNNLKVKKVASEVRKRTQGGLIVDDVESVPGVKLEQSSLPNPVRIGGVSIRYYDSGAKD